MKAHLSSEVLSQIKDTMAATFPFTADHSVFKIVTTAIDLGQALDANCWYITILLFYFLHRYYNVYCSLFTSYFPLCIVVCIRVTQWQVNNATYFI